MVAIFPCLFAAILLTGPVHKTAAKPRVDRSAATDKLVVPDPVAWQAALDRAGFSPGLIDGKLSRKTVIALQAFQRFSGLAVTGRPDAATRSALAIDSTSSTTTYSITPADEELVGPWPKTWFEKADAKFLGYNSLANLVAERGHCSVDLLGRLNRKTNLARLRAGDVLIIPYTEPPDKLPQAAAIEIEFTDKVVSLLDKKQTVIGLFHCSIAKDKENRPAGSCKVKVVKDMPQYVFDPAKWPEVKDVNRKLLIPPGPRCPVGLCWVGLSLEGYGIHGTPEPEMIGKTGSHGCFRLTNWDAQRLGKMVRCGTPVRFVEKSTVASAAK